MNTLKKKNLKPILCVLLLLLSSQHASAQFFNKPQQTLLPEEQAFSVTASVTKNGLLQVTWSIAEDYYMYRDNFRIVSSQSGIELGTIKFPEGVIENDPLFGEVEVYFYNATLELPLTANANNADNLTLTAFGQGCNKPVGVCYPPMQRQLSVDLSKAEFQATTTDTTSEPKDTSFLGYILAAFGAGLLLSFTPCVLPMIPILAGVIAGHHNPSKLQSGWLAICYVAGTVVTYIIAGALAGASGTQLQAHFQSPIAIGIICTILVVLALSLFGLFKIQTPSSIQSRLHVHLHTRSSSITAFVLGLVSALVVGACVSPILIVALGAAITQGDPLLGAAIMGSMSIGMGLLLIAFGFGAGWLLPKTGAWMKQIQTLFGFMVLGVAVYLLGTQPQIPVILLWGSLFICAGFYLWQICKQSQSPLVTSLLQAGGLLLLIWGSVAVIGGFHGGKDILRPLSSFTSIGKANTSNTALPFARTTTLAQTQSLLASAKQRQQPVMVDFYADWCLDCVRMQRTTFQEQRVAKALKNWQLIKVDVTNTSADSEAVKQYFKVFGPPAMLFYDASGKEITPLRQYGYMDTPAFLNHLKGMPSPSSTDL